MTEPGSAVPVTWITEGDVQRALGPSVAFTGDPYAPDVVAAANWGAFRKRAEAGYVDDPALSPGPDAAMGTVLWAVALWRERASTDGFSSFEALSSFSPVGGSWGQIRRLLGIGRAAVDVPLDPAATPFSRRSLSVSPGVTGGGR